MVEKTLNMVRGSTEPKEDVSLEKTMPEDKQDISTRKAELISDIKDITSDEELAKSLESAVNKIFNGEKIQKNSDEEKVFEQLINLWITYHDLTKDPYSFNEFINLHVNDMFKRPGPFITGNEKEPYAVSAFKIAAGEYHTQALNLIDNKESFKNRKGSLEKSINYYLMAASLFGAGIAFGLENISNLKELSKYYNRFGEANIFFVLKNYIWPAMKTFIPMLLGVKYLREARKKYNEHKSYDEDLARMIPKLTREHIKNNYERILE